jgi:hypothetical protein
MFTHRVDADRLRVKPKVFEAMRGMQTDKRGLPVMTMGMGMGVSNLAPLASTLPITDGFPATMATMPAKIRKPRAKRMKPASMPTVGPVMKGDGIVESMRDIQHAVSTLKRVKTAYDKKQSGGGLPIAAAIAGATAAHNVLKRVQPATKLANYLETAKWLDGKRDSVPYKIVHGGTQALKSFLGYGFLNHHIVAKEYDKHFSRWIAKPDQKKWMREMMQEHRVAEAARDMRSASIKRSGMNISKNAVIYHM